jgi:threonine aldolase
MRAAGARFHEWGLPQGFDGDVPEGEAIYRFVTSFATTVEEVDEFGELIA